MALWNNVSHSVLEWKIRSSHRSTVYDHLKPDVIKCLRDPHLSSVYNSTSRPHQGTCTWILEDACYLGWINQSECQFLWIQGPVGAGKSTLHRFIVHELLERATKQQSQTREIIICYAFSKRSVGQSNASVPLARPGELPDDRCKEWEVCIKELACQLVEADVALMGFLPKRFLSRIAGATVDDWLDFIKNVTSECNGVRIRTLIDGLDEACEDCRDKMILILAQLVKEDYFGRLSILTTDRGSPPTDLRELPAGQLAKLKISGDLVSRDVKSFVTSTVARFASKHSLPLAYSAKIERTILDLADGNFLHGKLAWANFSAGSSYWTAHKIDASLASLQRLPPSAEAYYCGLLARVPSDFFKPAKFVFTLIRYGRMGFTVGEIQHAIAATEGRKSVQDIESNLTFNLPERLPQLCGFLLDVALEDFPSSTNDKWRRLGARSARSIVRFAHKSVHDLFDSHTEGKDANNVLLQFRSSPSESHLELSRFCLQMLSLEDLCLPALRRFLVPAAHDPTNVEFWTSSPGRLLSYAIHNWDHHFTSILPETTLTRRLAKWLGSPHAYCVHVLRCKWNDLSQDGTGNLWKMPPGVSGDLRSQYIDSEDFRQTTRTSCERAFQMNASSTSPVPATFLLLEYGDFPDVAAALLEDERGNEIFMGTTPLSRALRLGRSRTARVLLRSDNLVLEPRSHSVDVKPLHWALTTFLVRGSRSPILTLYEDRQFPYMDHDAAESVALVEMLLKDPRTDHNATDAEGRTALHWFLADKWGSLDTRQRIWTRIKAYGAFNINAECRRGFTPLMTAFKEECNESIVLDLLRNPDANVDLMGAELGSHLLYRADLMGWSFVEDELLAHFPSHLTTPSLANGHSLFTLNAYMGRRNKVLKLLNLAPSSAWEALARGGGKWSLIGLCAQQDWQDIVRTLQESSGLSGAEPDHSNRTILHWATFNQWEFDDKYERLVQGSILDVQDKDGKTALHIASETSNVDAARWLLTRGASFLLPDKYGCNAVHAAAEAFSRSILDEFLECSTREFGRDLHGRSVLHFLAKWSDEQYLRSFCKRKKFIVNVRDHDKRTPLHYACLTDNPQCADVLLSLGASVNLRDANGFMPLHYALRNGSCGLVQLLLYNGADSAPLTMFGQNCLQLAIQSGSGVLMSIISEYPFDVRHCDSRGRTMIYDCVRAASDSLPKDVRYLERSYAGIVFPATSSDWLKALPEAFRSLSDSSGSGETLGSWRYILDALIQLGLSANQADIRGKTPLHIVVEREIYGLVSLLVANFRVRLSAADNHGCTPLDWALATGNGGIIDLLRSRGAQTAASEEGRYMMLGYWRPKEPLDDRPLGFWDTYQVAVLDPLLVDAM
jgi:ankyrin repeat protein